VLRRFENMNCLFDLCAGHRSRVPVICSLGPPPATPPCPQIPPPIAVVAHALTLEGLLTGTPTTQPRNVPQSPKWPEYGT
jgi:hypothetical protein